MALRYILDPWCLLCWIDDTLLAFVYGFGQSYEFYKKLSLLLLLLLCMTELQGGFLLFRKIFIIVIYHDFLP